METPMYRTRIAWLAALVIITAVAVGLFGPDQVVEWIDAIGAVAIERRAE